MLNNCSREQKQKQKQLTLERIKTHPNIPRTCITQVKKKGIRRKNVIEDNILLKQTTKEREA
jgi:hypothetical protein